MNATARFARMSGLGNIIIVADMRGRADRVSPAAAIALNGDPATRFDQIMAIHDPRRPDTQNYVEILNSDGSLAEICGNGMRCVVQALADDSGRTDYVFETAAGLSTARQHADGLISVDMGKPRFGWKDIPLARPFDDTTRIELADAPDDEPAFRSPSVMSMGNPHAIFWVERDLGSYELERLGPLLENNPIFPQRANITIAHVTAPHAMTIRTWERGAGLTLACGSAACASAVSAIRTGRAGRASHTGGAGGKAGTRGKVTVTMPGGSLLIEWRDDDHIVMTGPSERQFCGVFDPATGLWRPDRPEVG